MPKPQPQYLGPWLRVRLEILERDGYVCQIAGPGCTKRATCVDHIVAADRGGSWWDPANLRAACRPCNVARANRERHNRPSRDW